MPRTQLLSFVLTALIAVAFAGCSSNTSTNESTGSLNLNLELADGITIDEVAWLINGGDMPPMEGTIDTSAPGATASVEVFGLPPTIGKDYTIRMTATSTDGETTCTGSEDFGIDVGEVTDIMVMLNCKRPERLGAVRVNGEFNICAELAKVVVSPLQTSVGNDIDLSAVGVDVEGDPITYVWNATGGSIDDSSAPQTTYTCEEVGKHAITILVTDNDEYCTMATWTVPVTCVEGDGLECVDDEDCDEGEVCNDNNQCVPDVDCNDDQDCDTGFVCENFECVPDVECNENDDCDLGDICLDNVCRADPDLFCDTGLCAEDAGLRADCVGAFLACLADNVDEEECVVLSIAICTECTEDADCSGPVELTTNGGFEQGAGLPGWTQFCDAAGASCEATMAEAKTGLWSGNVAVQGGPTDSLIKNANIGIGTVTPNSPVTISFDLKGSAADGGVVFVEFFSELSGGGISKGEILSGGPLFPTDTWTSYSFNTTTGADVSGGVTLQLKVACGAAATCVGNAYFDNASVVVESSGVCIEGVCESIAECAVDGDCPPTGNECIDAVCNAGTCETSDNTNECDGGNGTCNAGVCEPNGGPEVVYAQDFNLLDISSPTIGDGWRFFANVFDSNGGFKFPYSGDAPNGTGNISAIVDDQGGVPQAPQQLSVFSDYACCGTSEGHFGTDKVEINVFEERTIAIDDVGKTLVFTFDAKGGNIEPPTTALAFIKTLDPMAGFSTSASDTVDTTNISKTTWGSFTLSIDITAALNGHILQFGFRNTASGFAGSSVYYDNTVVTKSPTP